MNTRMLRKHLNYRIPKVTLALIREPSRKQLPAIVSPQDLTEYVDPLRHYAEEHFVAFHLDTQHAVTGYQIVSHGTLSSSLVHPREVYKAALLSNAHSLIVAHNHPSGSTRVSEEDVQCTEQLIEAGQILGVSLIDHLIVTKTNLVSLRETRPELWI